MPKNTNTITEFAGKYKFLSNFYPSFVKFEDILYPTAEHAYQAQKTNDLPQRLLISRQPSPSTAKFLGRHLKQREDWDEVKEEIMRQVLIEKFLQNRKLARLLLATGNLHLEEGNYWHDNTWGICRCVNCVKLVRRPRNLLGKALMQVRGELAREKSGNKEK